MAKRVIITVLGMTAALSAVDAAAFTREAGGSMVRDPNKRQVSVSASRDGSQIRPGRALNRRDGSLRLDSLTVVEQAPSATVGGSLSQKDTGTQRALNGDLDL
ncbi:MAG: hypothetical protein HOJ21_03860 [Alphaproteobacteria bacterium]|nr:hypothetical protein [Alphaproteobacteria bacterium]